jgi:hypothetical protein
VIINAVRYRVEGAEDWITYRLSPGSGRLRGLAAVTAGGPAARSFVEAVVFVLSGRGLGSGAAPRGLEVSLQVSDDAGDTWVIHRQGEQVRYLRNGEAAGSAAATAFAQALLDLDGAATDAALEIDVTQVASDKHGLYGRPYAQETTTRDQLRDVLGRQIADLAGEAGKTLGTAELANPKTLARLAKHLEPLSAEYRELMRQWRELDLDGKAAREDGAQIPKLREEIELGRELAKVAAPLLEPGASIKNMQETLAKVDAAIAEICAACGLERLPGAGETRDYRKALEAVSRLEAAEKLIRATQAVRKHCEQRIEPVFKSYLVAVEGAMASDRQIAGELESCLATLDLKLRTKPAAGADAAARKNWFERFKTQKTEAEPELGDPLHDLETGRMAIEYALSRLGALGGDIEDAKRQQESALHAVDAALEELVRNYGRLKEHWASLAKQLNLAADLSLTQLLRIIGYHGKLVTLTQQRDEIRERIKQFSARHAGLERLVVRWRETTGSQKLTSLKTPGILLTEARDVVRYLEAKERKLAQLEETVDSQKAFSTLKSFMKGRRRQLETAWQQVFVDNGLAMLPPDHAYLPELFKRASLVKALALAHGTVSKDARQPLFKTGGKTGVAIYIWDAESAENQQKLELMKCLEQAELSGLCLVVAADAHVANLLQGLGAGVAQLAKRPAAKVVEKPVEKTAERRTEPPRPVAKAAPQKGAVTAPASETQRRNPSAGLMDQRAKAALDILTGQTKSPGKRT